MKNEKIAISLRINEDDYEEIKKIAEKEVRSINNQLEFIIKKGIEDYKKGK